MDRDADVEMETNEKESVCIVPTKSNEEQGISPLPPKVSNSNKRRRSKIWNHFTLIKSENSEDRQRATCNYCGEDYAADSRVNGTSTMSKHLKFKCKKAPKDLDERQTVLGFKPPEEGNTRGDDCELVDTSFSIEACRQALAEMLIIDELPFRYIEGVGFKKFMSVLQPNWTKMPSRVTVAKDCYNVYLNQKEKIKCAIQGQRICLTTDTWTSLQNLKYMCLTAHFIDSDWTLHKRILNFRIVESHNGETLGRAVEMCLLDWEIDDILTLTVDNASSDSGLIQFLKKKTKNRKRTILEHEFLHMRCCAHILNLVVRDGLKEFDESIIKVRNAVRYVKSSTERMRTFKLCAEKEKINEKSVVCLDVPTRWDYTYLMLDRAEKFQKAFERLEEEDINFLTSLGEDFGDEDVEGIDRREKKVVTGPPNNVDWDKIRLFVKFLKLFYDATLRFSGSKHVTCNSFFMELTTMQDAIDIESNEGEMFLKEMAENMKRKFEKYWGNFDNMNSLLYVALVLDPRYKLKYLEFYFDLIYNASKARELTHNVEDALSRLYGAYVVIELGENEQAPKLSRPMEESSTGGLASRTAQFRRQLEAERSIQNKNEVKKYLNENCEEDRNGFDILTWWKINSPRFPVLSVVARHVLAIPVATVAFESSFNTKGRVLDPFRSFLSPSMVEALICAQNWLRPSSNAMSLKNAMDDVEKIEKQLGLEFGGDASSIDSIIIEDGHE